MPNKFSSSQHTWFLDIQDLFSSINFIHFLLTQTWFLYFLISYQLYNIYAIMLRSRFRFLKFSSILPRFHICFSWKYNKGFVDIKEMSPSKTFQGRCVACAIHFTGEKKLVRFSFNTPEISAKIQKPIKYFNHGHNITTLFNVWPNFPFTTSEASYLLFGERWSNLVSLITI